MTGSLDVLQQIKLRVSQRNIILHRRTHNNTLLCHNNCIGRHTVIGPEPLIDIVTKLIGRLVRRIAIRNSLEGIVGGIVEATACMRNIIRC